jgi:hypothetical protein
MTNDESGGGKGIGAKALLVAFPFLFILLFLLLEWWIRTPY